MQKFRDFSGNRSVLFPSALATIAEGLSSRKAAGFSLPAFFCDLNLIFHSQKGIFIVIEHLLAARVYCRQVRASS
jgi:hypothetical protein